MLIALTYRRINLPGRHCVALIGIGLIGFALSAYSWGVMPRIIAWGFPATLVVAGAVLGPKLDASRIPCKALILLGDASYSLYLVYAVGFAIAGWVLQMLIDPRTTPLTYAILMVIIAVGVSIAVHLLVERPVTVSLKRLWASRVKTARNTKVEKPAPASALTPTAGR
jgi:peptidoglycan/LPS O-acetylase OafA/YrhL